MIEKISVVNRKKERLEKNKNKKGKKKVFE